jgi:tetratricopeptide (TPR) repeat protein
LKERHGREVLELVEYAMDRFESISRGTDDSYGGIGGTFEALRDLHHDACAAAKPDPEQLARQLFEWELEDYGNVFYHAAETYADVLGDEGMAAFRKLAETAWNKLPSLTPGQRKNSYEHRRYHLESIMEDLARRQGDLEALVAVKSRDLSSAHQYLVIAELYRENRKYKQAIQWAEDGLKAFPKRPDSLLRAFLAEEYHRKNRHDEAMKLIWANLEDRPDLHSYQELKAQAGGCTDDLWMELARGREKTHPADAVPIYEKHVESLVSRGGNDNYKNAVIWIKKIQPLMKAAGQKTEFTAYLQTLRAAHGRKRNLLALLDRIS